MRSFGYVAPETEPELLWTVAHAPQPTRVLSGGTWLVPMVKSGDIGVATVVDSRWSGLGGIAVTDSCVRIGAAATYTSVLEHPDVNRAAPLVGVMARAITGGPQIRHQGTIGGSAAYAYPSSDVPAALAAVDATLIVASHARGHRSIPARAFFQGAFVTMLEPDEALLAIEVPRSAGSAGYWKLKFGASSWPVVTAAALLQSDGTATVSVGAAFDRPVAVQLDPDELASGPGPIARRIIAAAADWGARPWSDEFADAAYRKAVTGVVVQRALAQAERAATARRDRRK